MHFKPFSLLFAALCLATAAGPSASAQTVLTMATGDAVGTLRNQVGNHVKDALDAAGGSVRVRHIEGPVLGNAAQIRDQVAEGSVDIMGTDAAWLSPYSDLIKATSFSFLFRDKAHLEKFFDSDMMRAVEEDIARKYGIRVLGTAVLPSRAFFTKRALNGADDFKGMKIRSPQLDNWLESYKALGANPTPVNWNEVFLALKTGMVDGGHGLPADIRPNNWHLAAPNIADLEDMFGIHVWFVNERRWQSLSETEKAELTAALDDATAWMEQAAADANMESILDMLAKGGGTFVSHNEEKTAMVASAVGDDRVAVFPEAEHRALRDAALDAARGFEGREGWWPEGMIGDIQSIR